MADDKKRSRSNRHKAVYRRDGAGWAPQITFLDGELKAIANIDSDPALLEQLRQIAAIYGASKTLSSELVSYADAKATLSDFLDSVHEFGEKIRNLPGRVTAPLAAASWRMRGVIQNYPALGSELRKIEIDAVFALKTLKASKTRIKETSCEVEAALSIRALLKRLKISVNVNEPLDKRPAIECMRIVLRAGGNKKVRGATIAGYYKKIRKSRGENLIPPPA